MADQSQSVQVSICHVYHGLEYLPFSAEINNLQLPRAAEIKYLSLHGALYQTQTADHETEPIFSLARWTEVSLSLKNKVLLSSGRFGHMESNCGVRLPTLISRLFRA